MLKNLENFIADVLTIFISYVLAVFIRYHIMEVQPGINTLSPPYLLIAITYCLIIASVLHYVQKDVVAVNAIGCLFFLAFLYTIGELYFSRLALVLFWVISSLLLGVKSMLVKEIEARKSFKITSQIRLLVVGGGGITNDFLRSVNFDSAYGYKIIGYVGKPYGIFFDNDFEVDNDDIVTRGWLGEFDELEKCIEKYEPDEIVFALENEELIRLGGLLDSIRNCCVKVSIVPSFNKYIPEGTKVRKIDETVVIDLNTEREVPSVGVFDLGLSLSTVLLMLMLIIKRFNVGYVNSISLYEGYRAFLFSISAFFGYQRLSAGKKGIKKNLLISSITIAISVIVISVYEVLYTQGAQLGTNIANDVLTSLVVVGFSVVAKIVLDSLSRSDIWFVD